MSGIYVRREPLDSLVVDGEALLLLPPDQVVRLSPIGAAIFEVTSAAVSLDDIANAVVARFGSPVDGEVSEVLPEMLDRLVEMGVLEMVDGV